MSTYRSFCYNPSPNGNISGTEQVGNIAAATGNVSIDPSKQWWNGPDEDLGYVVAYSDGTGTRSNGPKRILSTNYPCNLGFMRSSAKTDESFINLVKTISGSQSLASASAAKTWLTTNGYWTSWAAAAVSYLLDSYGGAAAAYSLRKLSSTYAGSAIRVRRSSDNTEQNIGFDGSGNLDTTALTTFVGAGNGFVTTWYDQSGNGKDASQSTASYQPQIVSSGVVNTINSKPSIILTNSYSYWNINSNYTYQTIFTTFKNNSTTFSEYSGILGGDGGSHVLNGIQGTKQLVKATDSTYYTSFENGNSITNGTFTSINTQRLGTFIANSPANQTATNKYLGAIESVWGRSWNGNLQEVIIYPTNQSSNRTSIESNINTYYSIYPTDADAAAFVSAAGITDSTQQSAVNTLVTDLKSANIWTKMMAIYPFVGGTATSHKFNLKDPRDLDAAYRLVFNGGWTHSSTGALPNGTNGHADTKFKPSNLSQNNNSFGFYSRTNIIAQQVEMGINTGYSGTLNIGANFLGAGAFARNFPSNINVYGGFTNTDTRGLYLSSRILSTEHKMYKNNTTLGTITVNSVTPDNTTNIALSAEVNVGNTSGLWYSTKELAFAFMGYGLTDAEVSSLYTAVQAFQTTLGRQV